MLQKLSLLLVGIFMLSACGENNTYPESPASGQIEEYNKELEECQDSAAEKAKELNDEQKAKESKPEIHVRGLGIEPDDIVFGNKDAKVVLLEYFSPTCPHCHTFHKRTFPEIRKKYLDTNKIAYVMREFIGNKQDLDATVLARCSGDLDKYVKFIHVILEQQDNWAYNKNYREILTNIGTLGGVNASQYAACLNNEPLIETLISNTKVVAKEPRFIGTPTFFINEKQFTKPYTLEELSKELDAALADGS